MHPRTTAKTKEITKTILEVLAVTSGIALLSFFAQGRRSEKTLSALTQYSAVRIRQTLRRLRLQKYVQYDVNDATKPIVLTEHGMARAIHFRLRDIGKKKKWDYLWRMVIFDIPEKQKHLRELFRRELQDAGFFSLQRSIFVSPFSCEKQIEELCACWHMQKYVLIFVVASLGSAEQKVRSHFFDRQFSSTL